MTDDTARETLTIDYIGGKCPVQAEGTINGAKFYFRARGKGWRFTVDDDPIQALLDNAGWYRHGHYDPENTGYGAGYMPLEMARKIIERCAEEYVKQGGKGECRKHP